MRIVKDKQLKAYILRSVVCLCIVLLCSNCSTTKYVPEKSYLLDAVEIQCNDRNVNLATLEPFIKQTANSKWFSVFKIPLSTYSLSGTDTTKWINRTLKNIGEEPVVYSEVLAEQSKEQLRTALHNLGYIHADVSTQTKVKGKKIKLKYILEPGESYYISRITYDIKDEGISRLLDEEDEGKRLLHKGTPFTVDRLEQERRRIASLLQNNGYYRFHKDFIRFDADSAHNATDIGLTLTLLPYRTAEDGTIYSHPRYKIRNVTYRYSDDSYSSLRGNVLKSNSLMESGKWFNQRDLQRTYNNFARLQVVKYTNIRFAEASDSILNCDITLSTLKPSTISFQPEGTNTAGDLGAAASLVYENRNLFRGGEVFSVRLRAAFEAITGLEGYQDQDYQEYGVETSLQFPRFVAPLLNRSFRQRSLATSQLSVSWNMQNRPEFHRRVFSTAWRYRWVSIGKSLSYRFDMIDLNYIYMPWISGTFKADYLDNETSRNAILRYNYEDIFIMRMGFAVNYNNPANVFRMNVETAGNVLGGLSTIFDFSRNANGQHSLFNIAYAQYAKADIDYTHLFNFDVRNVLALHINFGIAYPYGNSKILPFEKRYFSGGANSVRGWSVRELGPGSYRGRDGRIDFINQTGDMKLDMNAEYRTNLFWKFQGAVFVDAGNIWTLRSYEDQPGGQFKLNDFYHQLAVAYGIGLRLNFGYFILRFDMGMKGISPAYENHREHYPVLHPNLGRDAAYHFAVGLPF